MRCDSPILSIPARDDPMATHLFRVAILCRLWVLSASADAQQSVLDELFPDLDFTRLMMECIPSMERVRESRGEDAEAVKRAAANWDTMEENTEETSPHGFW